MLKLSSNQTPLMSQECVNEQVSLMGALMKNRIIITLLILLGNCIFGIVNASDGLQSGARYKIIQPVYVMGVYNSLNTRKLSKTTARAYLHSTRYYEKSEVAFQYEVPTGTIMTIIGTAPKVWYLPFLAKRYFVRLDPDLSSGLDVVLELNRGIEGDLDGLNPQLFARVNKSI